jgi:hypothetical protein
MSMFRFPRTIPLRRRLIMVRRTMTNLRASLDRLIHNPGFLRGLIHSPKRATSKAPTTTTTLGAMFDLDATAFSIGLGNIINDSADRLLAARTEIWVEK